MDTKELKRLFSEKRPSDWEQIPDIDLYMDQVTSYMQRQHIGFEVNENLTPAMINNYVKQKVMPKANGKKYDRDHIAYLTAIVLLKQVISVGDVKTLLGFQLEDEDIRIVRTKRFDIEPMYPEDACVQMELLGHSFFVLLNAENEQVSVVYKRKGGTYGLIEPEF